jgi:hypothetical protein
VGGDIIVARELSGRVGLASGSALTCQNIARSGVEVIASRFRNFIADASAIDAERDSDCGTAERRALFVPGYTPANEVRRDPPVQLSPA